MELFKKIKLLFMIIFILALAFVIAAIFTGGEPVKYAREYFNKGAKTVEKAADTIQDTAERAADKTTETVDSARQKLSETLDGTSENAGKTAENAEKVKEAADSANETIKK